MVSDVTKLTMEERRDILWAILPQWVGPIELPGTGDAKKSLAVMPIVFEKRIEAGETGVLVSACVNRPFKPHRMIIQEPAYCDGRTSKVFLRNYWMVDSFFVGDTPAMLKYGAVNGDVFGVENCLDLDWPTAQRGHMIQVRVWHNGPVAMPFHALLLGTVPKSEDFRPFVPQGDGTVVKE